MKTEFFGYTDVTCCFLSYKYFLNCTVLLKNKNERVLSTFNVTNAILVFI